MATSTAYYELEDLAGKVSEASQGWTISFIGRENRYWIEASNGLKDSQLFEQGVQRAWQWAKPSDGIRWFTDGERRYG